MIQLSTFLFIGTAEVMVILVIVVLVFGADKIPEIAKGLGKGMRSLKDASKDIRSDCNAVWIDDNKNLIISNECGGVLKQHKSGNTIAVYFLSGTSFL